MKRYLLLSIIIIFLSPILSLVSNPSYVSAQGTYKVLSPLPGTTDCGNDITVAGGAPKEGCSTELKTYLPGVFKLAIGLSAVWAVFMIVIGGFQYMTSDALGGKKDGLAKLQNSVLGLVLVICS